MIKRYKKANTLIKRKKLVWMLKEAGIKRVNKEAISALENYLIKELNNLIGILKEEIIIRGRRTLEKEDIQKLSIRKDDGWET